MKRGTNGDYKEEDGFKEGSKAEEENYDAGTQDCAGEGQKAALEKGCPCPKEGRSG